MDNSETKVERRQLTAREKVFLTVTLLAVIGAGFYTFEYKALTARMAGAQNQLVILADNIKTYQEAFRLIHS
ncbi:MAG: hypothetical protein GWM98_04055, partial [Nitrospinaceae bacterium]|nr:hypothetical protein [Nitrospinaceae bacterium]NIR53830.1 hypothetical protein [Nitrospinaceae bacterium]NIS84241.1 hypothetical protein [Nitrospinaceae bacterium]NIT81045.1 hypothetical protein [Nitrospinaceae bacterium]NIU43336.1 hypothetical protein [Nitrospinaceae bacterium]